MRTQGDDRTDAPEARLAMVLMRYLKGWRQSELAEATGIAQSQISLYDQGRQPVPRRALERIADAVGFPRPLLDPLLQMLRLFRLAARSGSRVNRAYGLAALLSGLLTLAREATDFMLSEETPPLRDHRPSAPSERAAAEALWQRLAARSPAEQQALLEEAQEFQSWALCERLARESVEVAGSDPRGAIRLSLLAVSLAEIVPVPGSLRSRLRGYALTHLANAYRVCGDLPAAKAALAQGKGFWEAGAQDDPGLLNGVWVVWIEATLLHAEARYGDALTRIEVALALDEGSLRARLLYTKARILEATGNIGASTALLREAASLADPAHEPRLALGLAIQFSVNLCEQGLAHEAERQLAVVRRLAHEVGGEADITRALWLEGRVTAALGRSAEARALFDEVRRYFERQVIPYDYALASLELSLVLLGCGETAEVRVLATDLFWIFHSQGVPENALAAVRVFYEAAKREEATVELTQRVLDFVRRAAHEPDAVFVPEGE